MRKHSSKPVSKPCSKEQTLYIKNPDAHRLAQQLSKRMGVTLTEAVIYALQDKVQASKPPVDWAQVDKILAKFAALPILDTRTEDEILGYNEFGIPS